MSENDENSNKDNESIHIENDVLNIDKGESLLAQNIDNPEAEIAQDIEVDAPVVEVEKEEGILPVEPTEQYEQPKANVSHFDNSSQMNEDDIMQKVDQEAAELDNKPLNEKEIFNKYDHLKEDELKNLMKAKK